jgi:hypothetical protein
MSEYKGLDIEKLKKFMAELKPDTDREFIVMQGCLTKGIVQRSTLDLNLCSNPDCTSCQQYHNSLKKHVENYEK